MHGLYSELSDSRGAGGEVPGAVRRDDEAEGEDDRGVRVDSDFLGMIVQGDDEQGGE